MHPMRRELIRALAMLGARAVLTGCRSARSDSAIFAPLGTGAQQLTAARRDAQALMSAAKARN